MIRKLRTVQKGLLSRTPFLFPILSTLISLPRSFYPNLPSVPRSFISALHSVRLLHKGTDKHTYFPIFSSFLHKRQHAVAARLHFRFISLTIQIGNHSASVDVTSFLQGVVVIHMDVPQFIHFPVSDIEVAFDDLQLQTILK